MKQLPKALLKELPQYNNTRAKYTGKELVLALLANSTSPVTTEDMLIYAYRANKTIIKRTYLYQMLYRLRVAGFVADGEFQSPLISSNGSRLNAGTKCFVITEEGRQVARPYVEVTE